MVARHASIERDNKEGTAILLTCQNIEKYLEMFAEFICKVCPRPGIFQTGDGLQYKRVTEITKTEREEEKRRKNWGEKKKERNKE